MRLPISLLGCSVMPGIPQRRFPPPWSVEETDACFIVRDKNGQARAYVYFEEEPEPATTEADLFGFSPKTTPVCGLT
jgi:hypothetical protein